MLAAEQTAKESMRIKNLNNTAFSLLEVLLASIIFIISITGVFVSLTAMRRPVADKESALAAAVFGKQVLEALRSSVNAGTFYSTDNFCLGTWPNVICTDFSLALGTHQVILPGPSTCGSSPLCWPSSTLAGANSCLVASVSTTGCLVYNVKCGDNSVPTGTVSTFLDCGSSGSNDIARRVDLSINWPNAS
jgi:type II secretory pathway pseudopilin PulG